MGHAVEEVKEFELAIIRQREYDNNATCPHCELEVMDEKLLTYVDTADLVGFVNQCIECHKPFMVVEYPQLHNPSPFFMNWKLKD